MNNDRSFGDWLRQHRRALDLTQEELARQVGCSAITLRKLEAEVRKPSKQIAERLAEVLQVPPDDRPSFLRFARGDPFAAPASASIAEKLNQTPAPRHNLPLQLTSFIGRVNEIAEIRRLLSPPGATRLLTLTGAGGSGKTRLALQVAAGLFDDFPDGVWLVELAPLVDPALVPQTVAAVLGLRDVAGRVLTDVLLDYLRPKQLLLVLDNCEHLIQASAELAEKLPRACPQLTILATSRERLAIAGEATFVVPSLSLPAAAPGQSPEIVAQSESVRLFTKRAQAAMPAFTLTKDNAQAVAQVCRQLDGMPLAIELAAARVSVLRVEQIAARLDDRFQLLTSGSRTALPRHQTLQALIDWSHDLLSPAEQTLLRRLAVFAGGWTLEMAEAASSDKDAASTSHSLPRSDVLGLLSQLVNKSLIVAQRVPGHETRYYMLETIRQYALARLSASGEADAVLERLATYLIELEATFRPFDHFPSEVDRLETERDNLRAALAWSLSATGSPKLGLHLAVIMFALYGPRGDWSECRGWLEAALARADADGQEYPWCRARALGALGNMVASQGDLAAGEALLARSLKLHQQLGEDLVSGHVLNRLGVFARERGDAVTARLRLEDGLALFRELGDQAGIAGTSLPLAEVASMQGDTERATTLLQEALAYFRAHDNPVDIGWALNHLGHVAQIQGDYERARQLHEESLSWFLVFGAKAPMVVWALESLGEAALAQDQARDAVAHFTKALTLARDLGDRPNIAWCLAGLAGVALLDEDPERAAQLWGVAEALRRSIGAREAPASHATHQRLMAAAREQLGEVAFAAAWAAGEAASIEAAIEHALQSEAEA